MAERVQKLPFRGRGNSNSWFKRHSENGQGTSFRHPVQLAINTGEPSALYGISYEKVRIFCEQLDSKKILDGSTQVTGFVQNRSFITRLGDLWPEEEKRVKFLQIIVSAISSTYSDTFNLRREFLQKLLDSNLISILCEENVSSIRELGHDQALLLDYMISIFTIGMEVLPTKTAKHAISVTMLLLLTDKFVDKLPSATVDKLGKLKMLHEEAAQKKSKGEACGRREPRRVGSAGNPSTNFRDLSITPNADDINLQEPVFLRSALKEGSYNNDEHYLDVQFRLLHEDCVRPLRDGIQHYHTGGTNKLNLFVYKDLKISHPTFYRQSGEFLHYINFQIRRKMRWDKRLKYGSLLCISSDDFKTDFKFAVVCDRDEETLRQSMVGVRFEGFYKIDFAVKYKMVESPAFFEAYKHVMAALQSFPYGKQIPFSKYLVSANLDTKPPEYLVMAGYQMDFKDLLKEQFPTPEEPKEKKPKLIAKFMLEEDKDTLNEKKNIFDTRTFNERLKRRDFGFDESQFAALHYALNSDLAILQGPPGTGKTFMGLSIARLLFLNEKLWNNERRPMLVVCYTNHALDQFLEGISLFLTNGIIRIGGRCKNPALEKFMLRNHRSSRVEDRDRAVNAQYYDTVSQCNLLCSQLDDAVEHLDYLRSGRIVKNDFHLFEAFEDLVKACPMYEELIQNDVSVWLTERSTRKYVIDYSFFTSVKRLVEKNKLQEVFAMNFAYSCYEIGIKEYINMVDLLNDESSFYFVGRIPYAHLYDELADYPTLNSLNAMSRLGYSMKLSLELLGYSKRNLPLVIAAHNFCFRAQTQRVVTNRLDPQFDNLKDFEHGDDGRLIDDEYMIPLKKNKKKVLSYNSLLLEVFERIKTILPFSEADMRRHTKIWKMSMFDRWRLCKFVSMKLQERDRKVIADTENELAVVIHTREELQALRDVDIMRNAKVVGMTTTGAAKHQAALQTLKPKIVIVEEAAEVLEAHILSSLTTKCEHLILIGDHKQLRPNPAVCELARKYNFDVSLFERMINNRFPYKMLTKQHRMCQDISRTLMPHFYTELMDDESVLSLPPVVGVRKNLFFINHHFEETCDIEFNSHSNTFEADYAVALARYLLQQEYRNDQITILTTYLDQLLLLKKRKVESGLGNDVRIDVVDNYQGEECDIIILSLVRSNNPEGKIGFLATDNRICVALSRAKRGLFVVANMDFLASASEKWKDIRESVDSRGFLGDGLPVKCQMHECEQVIRSAVEFSTKCPEGGCNQKCEFRKDCGHVCRMPCHADIDHTKKKCLEPCPFNRSCPVCHSCAEYCYTDCGPCKTTVGKLLNCGHVENALCYMPIEKLRCSRPCANQLSCGHQCLDNCNQPCGVTKCTEYVLKEISTCGHMAKVKCSNDMQRYKCVQKINKLWPICSHTNETSCSTKVEVTKCQKDCNAVLECGHLCKGTCATCRNGRLHVPCDEPCKKILICNHECKSKCFQSCPPCVEPCDTACVHSKCCQAKKNKSRRCGEVCPECVEKCSNFCKHRKCEYKCGEECSVPMCTEPCRRELPCSSQRRKKFIGPLGRPHYCIGVCGENCIKDICKICTPKKFEELQEILFGFEDEEAALFVKLVDCGHIMEMKGLDRYIETKLSCSENAITPLDCPKCKTKITRSKRYVCYLNRNFASIQKIKKKIIGNTVEVLKKRKEVLDASITKEKLFSHTYNTSNFVKLKDIYASICKEISLMPTVKLTENYLRSAENVFVMITKRLINFEEFKVISVNMTTQMHKFYRIMKRMSSYVDCIEKETHNAFMADSSVNWIKMGALFKIMEKYKMIPFKDNFLKDVLELMSRLDNVKVGRISDFMFQQLTWEIDRLEFMLNLIKWLVHIVIDGQDLLADSCSRLETILTELNGPKAFAHSVKSDLEAKAEELRRLNPVSGFCVTNEELFSIKKALSGNITNWYECPNGHPYGIGECGGAMQEAKCVECGASIGGRSHRLQADNRVSRLNENRIAFPPAQFL